MPVVYDERTFDGESIKCTGCGWEGNGDETYIIDFYGLVNAKESHCPNCDRKLGDIRTYASPKGESSDEISFQIG